MADRRPTKTTVTEISETGNGIERFQIGASESTRSDRIEHPLWLLCVRFLVALTIRSGLLCASWYLWMSAGHLYGWTGLAAAWVGASAALWILECVERRQYLRPEGFGALVLTTAVYFPAASLLLFALPSWLFWPPLWLAGLTPTWRLYA